MTLMKAGTICPSKISKLSCKARDTTGSTSTPDRQARQDRPNTPRHQRLKPELEVSKLAMTSVKFYSMPFRLRGRCDRDDVGYEVRLVEQHLRTSKLSCQVQKSFQRSPTAARIQLTSLHLRYHQNTQTLLHPPTHQPPCLDNPQSVSTRCTRLVTSATTRTLRTRR